MASSDFESIVRKSPWVLLGLVASWFLLGYFFSGINYSVRSSLTSPNGRMTIYEVRSQQDGLEHAPYGTMLVLSFRKPVRQPDDGYVFFGGYCKDTLLYRWESDTRISVSCKIGDRVRTLVSRMYDIDVSFNEKS